MYVSINHTYRYLYLLIWYVISHRVLVVDVNVNVSVAEKEKACDGRSCFWE